MRPCSGSAAQHVMLLGGVIIQAKYALILQWANRVGMNGDTRHPQEARCADIGTHERPACSVDNAPLQM